MINFTKIKLGDVGNITTGRTPNTSDAENFGSEYMFLGPTDLHKHFIITKSEKYITGKGLASVNSSVIDGLSICVGCIGWDMGNVALVNEKCATNQQINSITKVKDEYHPYYIYYWLKGKKDFLFQQANVTRTPILNKTDFSNIDIWLPSKSQQDKIANILSTIDEKIEVNNKISAKLEAMAKLIYDYWFVQFDFPDENGKHYKSSGGKMIYNEELKCDIPEGWTNTPLSKITPVGNSSVNPADYPNKNFRHFSIPVYDATNTFGIEAGETIGSNKFLVEEEDILVSKLNPRFRRVIFATEEEDLICSTEFVVWRTPNNGIKNFLYMLAISPQFTAHCTQSATGTSNSHKRVNPEVMMRFELPFDKKVAGALGRKLEPMIKTILINQRENTELVKLRDWLLPMLMNGQVTVE